MFCQLRGTDNKYAIFKGTQYSSTDAEEAQLVLTKVLDVMIDRRLQYAEEDAAAQAALAELQHHHHDVAAVPPLPHQQQVPVEIDGDIPELVEVEEEEDDDVGGEPAPAQPAAAPAGGDAEDIIRKILLMLHGEFNKVDDILNNGIGLRAKLSTADIMKLAAACSKTQQANDVMKAFLILHAYFRSNQFYTYDLTKGATPVYMKDIMTMMAPIPKASRDVFQRYFHALEHIVNSAYSTTNILHGYEKCGMAFPPSVDTILKNCPSLDNLFTDEYAVVRDAVFEIAIEGMVFSAQGEGGTINDATMEKYVGHRVQCC